MLKISGFLNVNFTTVGRRNHLLDRQFMLRRKLPVARIVAGDGHDRTGAIAHQHEIGDPQRHPFAAKRMHSLDAERHAFLFHCLKSCFCRVGLLAFFNKCSDRRIVFSRFLCQRVLSRHSHVGNAHQGVRPRRINRQQIILTRHLERQLHALGAANPVPLHGLDRIGPARHVIKLRQQFIGIGCDFHEPLRDLAPFDKRIGTPATTVDNLFVRQHGLVHRIPVHDRILAVHEPLLEHPRKQPLLPAVVLRATGGNLAAPVIGVAHALELRPHVINILVGPLCGRDPALDSGIFGRHAKGIPAHRLQNMLTLHTLVAGNNVADRKYPNVPHVQLAAGVRKHRQAVKFFLVRIFADFETT